MTKQPSAAEVLHKARSKAKREKLENKFEMYWRAIGGPNLQREYMFHDLRKWRFDFAHPATKTAIEIEGGTWINGGHNRGKGYRKNCEKYLQATLMGWSIFRLTGEMIHATNLDRMEVFIRRKDWVNECSPAEKAKNEEQKKGMS